MDQELQLKTQNLKPSRQVSNLQQPISSLPFWRQLRWNLVLYFVALAVIPLAVVVTIILNQVGEQAKDQVRRQLESVAELKISEINRWLDDTSLALSIFLSTPVHNRLIASVTTSTPDQQELASLNIILKRIVESRDEDPEDDLYFLELFVYNLQGQIVMASDPSRVGQIVANQPYFTPSLAKEFIQPPFYELGHNELTMIVTHPLRDEQNGQNVGVLATRLDLKAVSQIMAERAGLGDTGETYLISPENNILVTPSRFESEGYTLTRGAYKTEGIERALRGENGFATYPNYRKPAATVIGVYRWLPELRVGLLAEVEEAEALTPFVVVRNSSLGVAVAAVLAAIIVGLFSAARISRPIAHLTQAANRIATGDLEQRTEVKERNEIGLLASVFNAMTAQLRALIGSLEDYTQRLGVVASVSERLSAILNVEELLPDVINQVKDKFGYYQAHIYLLDETREKLIIAEATGAAGEMKAGDHNIPLDAPTSLVAHAARTGKIVKVDNVRETTDWLPSQLLPNTYSEMAVPIILEGQVLGVLDVQQDQIGGLDEGDANLLRSLANQVAVAIRNARLFAEVETALNEARELQQRYVEQSWDKTRVTRKNVGRVQFSLGESTTLSETIIAELRQQALTHREPAIATFDGSDEETAISNNGPTSHALVAPIVLRDVPIGDVQLYEDDPNREWTEGELALLRAVVDQVAQVAEHLRLLDETQERASREQLVSQISNKMRRAPDMESLMQVAVAELSRVLGPARTFVHMGLKAELGQNQVAEAKETQPVEPASR